MSPPAPRRWKERHSESIGSRFASVLKPHRLSDSIAAVCVGGALAIGEPGYSRWPLWAVIALSALLLQLGGRLLLAAAQARRTSRGTSRGVPDRGLAPSRLTLLGGVAIFSACFLGFVAVIERGWDLFWLGVAAVLATINFAQGLALRDRALGEAIQFFLFGPFPVVGAYLAVTGVTSPLAFQISVPLGLLAAAGALVASIRDAGRGGRSPSYSLATILGPRRSELLYLALVASAHSWLLILVFRGLLAPICLLPLLTLYQAVQGYAALRRRGRDGPETYASIVHNNERMYLYFATLFAISIAVSHLIVERAI